MKKIIISILLISVLLLGTKSDLSIDLEASWPLGSLTPDYGSYALTDESTSSTPITPVGNSYEFTVQDQFLETDISYLTGDFTISIWSKNSKNFEEQNAQNTIFSIRYKDFFYDQDIQWLNVGTEIIKINKLPFSIPNQQISKTQKWEFIAIIRKDDKMYIYGSSIGFNQLTNEYNYDINQQPHILRIANTITNYYSKDTINYQYIGILKKLKINNRALTLEECLKEAYPDYAEFNLNDIQIAHYPLNTNLKEIQDRYPRLHFVNPSDLDQPEVISGYPTYDRKENKNSAVSLETYSSLRIPLDFLQDITTSFSMSVFINGIGVQNSVQTIFDIVQQTYQAFVYQNDVWFDKDGHYSYPFEENIFDGKWKLAVWAIDITNQKFKFCYNQNCMEKPFPTSDYFDKLQTKFIGILGNFYENNASSANGYVQVDDLRIFNTYLTDYQINSISTQSTYISPNDQAQKEPNLINHYRLRNHVYGEIFSPFKYDNHPSLVDNYIPTFQEMDFGSKKVVAADGLLQLGHYFSNQIVSTTLTLWAKLKYDNFYEGTFILRQQFANLALTGVLSINVYPQKININGNIQVFESQIVEFEQWVQIGISTDIQNSKINLYKNGQLFKQFDHTYADDYYFKGLYISGEKYYMYNYKLYDGALSTSKIQELYDYELDTPFYDEELEEKVHDNPPPSSEDPSCLQKLYHLNSNEITVDFAFPFQDDLFHHKYTVDLKDFDYDESCFDITIKIGNVEQTFTKETQNLIVLFPHKDAEIKGCEKQSETDLQCKFALRVFIDGVQQAQRLFTSYVKTPNLDDIQADITFGVLYDDFDDIQNFDTSLETSLKLCTDETCTDYKTELELIRNDLSYLEFKITSDGYSNYYPVHQFLKMNNNDLLIENQDQITSWNQQGRIIYHFKPLLAGDAIMIAAKISLSRTNPQGRRFLLEDTRDNIGNYLYVKVDEQAATSHGNQQKEGNKKKKDDGKDNDGNNILIVGLGSGILFSIVTTLSTFTIYKLKNDKKMKEQQYQESIKSGPCSENIISIQSPKNSDQPESRQEFNV